MIDLDAAEKLDALIAETRRIYELPSRLRYTSDVDSVLEALMLAIDQLTAEVRQLRTRLADAHEQLDACCERCLDKCPHSPKEQP